MDKYYEASRSEDLARINELIHDRFFEIARINYDEKAKVVSIPISVICPEGVVVRKVLFLSQWQHPVVAAILMIQNVEGFSLSDKAQIGEADITKLDYRSGELVIECGVDVTVRMRVSALKVALEISDDVVSTKRYFRLSAAR